MAEFTNPNQQGGGDNKSLLVMMVVLVTVFFGLQYFRSKNNPQTVSPNAAPNAAQTVPAQPAAPAAGIPVASAPAAVQPGKPAVSSVPAVQAAAESTTTIENELYKISFTNRGAQVTSWILKKYKDADGKPLNLVHTQAADQFGYPLSLYTYDACACAGAEQGAVCAFRHGHGDCASDADLHITPMATWRFARPSRSTRRMCCTQTCRSRATARRFVRC